MSDQQEIRLIYQSLVDLKSIVDVLSWIASRFDKAVDQLEDFMSIDDVLREQGQYLVETLDRFDQMFLLILERLPPLEENGNISAADMERITSQTAQLKKDAIDNRIKSLRVQIDQCWKNINKLEEQSALYGFDLHRENLIKQWYEEKDKKESELTLLLQD
ncbi:MAG: hypothetical protein GF334_03825 [Candidatus Altiarchaeales archaeon]|nr:hypothetical protein [Candidatus Altiarchaeales archaeon]